MLAKVGQYAISPPDMTKQPSNHNHNSEMGRLIKNKNKFIINNEMNNQIKKQLSMTFRDRKQRPRLKTQPNSRTKPNYHHNSQHNYANDNRVNFNINTDNLTLPTLYKFSTDNVRAKTQVKYEDAEDGRAGDRKRSAAKDTDRDQEKLIKQESQSDKILNQFLINYFKKKNKFALKARASKLKREHHTYQPDFLKQANRNKKDKSQQRPTLVTNSIDAYFDINNLVH